MILAAKLGAFAADLARHLTQPGRRPRTTPTAGMGVRALSDLQGNAKGVEGRTPSRGRAPADFRLPRGPPEEARPVDLGRENEEPEAVRLRDEVAGLRVRGLDGLD